MIGEVVDRLEIDSEVKVKRGEVDVALVVSVVGYLEAVEDSVEFVLEGGDS